MIWRPTAKCWVRSWPLSLTSLESQPRSAGQRWAVDSKMVSFDSTTDLAFHSNLVSNSTHVSTIIVHNRSHRGPYSCRLDRSRGRPLRGKFLLPNHPH